MRPAGCGSRSGWPSAAAARCCRAARPRSKVPDSDPCRARAVRCGALGIRSATPDADATPRSPTRTTRSTRPTTHHETGQGRREAASPRAPSPGILDMPRRRSRANCVDSLPSLSLSLNVSHSVSLPLVLSDTAARKFVRARRARTAERRHVEPPLMVMQTLTHSTRANSAMNQQVSSRHVLPIAVAPLLIPRCDRPLCHLGSEGAYVPLGGDGNLPR